MRYGIIGTGAIGGYYGAKLAQAKRELWNIMRRDGRRPFGICRSTV